LSDRKLKPLPPDPFRHQNSAIAPWVRCSWSDDTRRISRTFDLDAVELLDVASYMSDRLSALPALPSTSSDQPDVILASSSTNLTVIQQATSTVPVVFVQVSDPHK